MRDPPEAMSLTCFVSPESEHRGARLSRRMKKILEKRSMKCVVSVVESIVKALSSSFNHVCQVRIVEECTNFGFQILTARLGVGSGRAVAPYFSSDEVGIVLQSRTPQGIHHFF